MQDLAIVSICGMWEAAPPVGGLEMTGVFQMEEAV